MNKQLSPQHRLTFEEDLNLLFGYPLTVRPEQISVSNFINIFNSLQDKNA
mgnify:CR=1 FL=1